MLELKGNNAIW